jgi:hypothetical protein
MQMVGLWRPSLHGLRRDGSKSGSFSIYHFVDERDGGRLEAAGAGRARS